MKNKFKYGRYFILFKQEDKGYGNINSPSGFIQLDVKADKCRFSAVVQDFGDMVDKFDCNLYIIKCREKDFKKVCLGKIPINNGKGETYWDINPEDIKGSGLTLQDFDVISLLLEDKNGESKRIICPLAAYIGEKVEWRKKLEDYKKRESIEIIEDIKEEKEITDIDSDVEIENVKDNYLIDASDDEINTENDMSDNDNGSETGSENLKSASTWDEQNADDENNVTFEENCDNTDDNTENNNFNNEYNCDKGMENPDYIENNEEDSDMKNEKKTNIYNQQNIKNICESCYIRNTCTEMNRSQNPDICNMYIQGINQNINFESGNQYNQKPIIEEFTRCMNSFFERSEPFGSKRKDYVWWKINSPVQLNNVLYRINLKNSILFNPKVLMAHFKYRHLIIGIYKNAAKNRQYIVYGVPGVYGIEDRPFGNICRWAQVEGNKPRYGAFGYWLIYLEPDTGKIITVV